MRVHRIMIPLSGGEEVSGVVHVPAGYVSRSDSGIILAHGAGGDLHTPILVTLAERLCEAGLLVLRFNFPYKEKGRKAPDRMPVLIKTWDEVCGYLKGSREWSPKRIAAAGKSLGGRAASMAAAEGRLAVDRLVFFGYPLHPPGRREELRDAHLYRIAVPMLFFAGTRDPLCDLNLLHPVLERLKSPHVLEVVTEGDHSFNLPKSSGRDREEVWREMARKTAVWFDDGGKVVSGEKTKIKPEK